MTILEASQELLTWFSKNDSFSIIDDSKTFLKKDNLTLNENAAVSLALNDLEKMGLINRFVLDSKEIWVMKKPLALLSQSVEISGQLSIHIANIINNFFSLTDDKENMCDSSNISQDDIAKLVEICSYLAQNVNFKEETQKK